MDVNSRKFPFTSQSFNSMRREPANLLLFKYEKLYSDDCGDGSCSAGKNNAKKYPEKSYTENRNRKFSLVVPHTSAMFN